MSYYYNFYLGYKKDGLFYPLGPFDMNANIVPVVSYSAGNSSGLHEGFYVLDKSYMSDSLRECLCVDEDGNTIDAPVSYCMLKDLPKGDFIKRGYYLIDDVEQYELNKDCCPKDLDIFYDKLSPTVYSSMLLTQSMTDKAPETHYDDGEVEERRPATDYMYYCYPDWWGKEYQADILREAMIQFFDYSLSKDVEYVILETEG